MAENSLKQKSLTAVLWKLAETGATQLIQFILSVVLARLIMPDQFGAIAMLSIFIAISSTFIDSGFSSALIRKTNRTNIDSSTVFYFNIIIAITAYAILYLCAPFIAEFYELPILKPVLRISSLTLIINSFASVQNTLLRAELEFKTLAKCNVISVIFSGLVGVIMAYYDFQVWALVIQSLTYSITSLICYWCFSKWRPIFAFSWSSFKEFFGFGSKILASGLLESTYSNIYGVVIGKVFKASDLAFYNRSESLTKITSAMPTNILQSVTYPTLCKLQGDDDKLRESYRKILRISAFLIFPICLGIGSVSYPLINVVYTEKWIFSALLLQIVVFSGMWYPIHAVNLNLLIVKGRSDLFFRLEIIKKIIGICILCITVPMGLIAMCYGGVVTSILCLAVNTYYTGKLLNMGFWQQMKDYLPFLLLSVLMYIICKIVTTLLGNDIVSLMAGIATGAIIYLGGAIIFRFPELKELKTLRK